MNIIGRTAGIGAAPYVSSLKADRMASRAEPSRAGDRLSEGAQTFDFTYMTNTELKEALSTLGASGALTMDQSSALVPFVKTPLSKVIYDGQVPADANQPRDILAQMQAAIDGAMSRNDSKSADFLSNALDALKTIQGSLKRVDLVA